MTDKSKNLFCKDKKTYNPSQSQIVLNQKDQTELFCVSLILALDGLCFDPRKEL